MLTGLITTFTCAFGGASIRKVEAIPEIDPLIVKLHAWTAMLAFLLSLALAYYSFMAVRKKGDLQKTDKLLLLISSVFIALFICTTVIAFKIR